METTAYWNSGFGITEYLSQALINVEKINGPILLLSGVADKVWPSSFMADMIEKRINQSGFNFSFENIKYENAGHLISSHPETDAAARTGKMRIGGRDYEYGGTNEGDIKAKQNAKIEVLAF